MNAILIEVVGWAGAVLIVAAYALLSAGRLAADSRVYQALNIAGAAGLVVNGYARGALPSAALNVVWIGIACYALWRRGRARADRP